MLLAVREVEVLKTCKTVEEGQYSTANTVLLPSKRCINVYRPRPTPHVAQLVYSVPLLRV